MKVYLKDKCGNNIILLDRGAATLAKYVIRTRESRYMQAYMKRKRLTIHFIISSQNYFGAD